MRKIIAFLTILSGLSFVVLLIIYLNLLLGEKAVAVKQKEAYKPPAASALPALENTTQKFETYEAEIAKALSYDGFYAVNLNGITVTFNKLSDYIEKARHNSYDIYYKNNKTPIINNNYSPPASYYIEGVPLIMQNPELPRGCEVTSLAMLMAYCQIETDKLILAEKITRDTTPREIKNKKIYWGNPDNGFIGDMYDIKKPGLGVYHTPIFELLAQYEPERAVDLTGCNFEDLLWLINNNMPVWLIINTTYSFLPEGSFQTWVTPDGEIKITYSEHSALITGYDETFVYLNDPLFSNIKVKRGAFIECWEQMGRQAVTLNP